MRFVCVLKTGGDFKARHVGLLADGIRKHHPESSIYCLSDSREVLPEVERVPLVEGWPGWWSKIELFRPGLFDGPTLYMDLDSVVVSRIDVDCQRFTMLSNVYRKGDYGSGLMAWTTPPGHVYEAFRINTSKHIARYRTTRHWGDQGFIRDNLGHKPAVFGSQFKSYKAQCKRGVPEGTSVVYFHGRPRPWEVYL